KSSRPFFPPATGDTQSGRPCSFRLGLSSPVDVSRAQLATLFDAPRSIAAIDRAVFVPHPCSRNRTSRRRRFQPKAASNFASTDATKARQPLEQRELNAELWDS